MVKSNLSGMVSSVRAHGSGRGDANHRFCHAPAQLPWKIEVITCQVLHLSWIGASFHPQIDIDSGPRKVTHPRRRRQ